MHRERARHARGEGHNAARASARMRPLDLEGRRRPRAPFARLALLLAANAAAVALLVRMLVGGGDVEPAHAAEPLAHEPPLSSTAVAEPVAATAEPDLAAVIQRAIARSVRSASDATNGKVASNDVTVAVHVRELGRAG